MSTDTGKVVVNRAMSLDGFIAGPGHTMDWIFDFVTPDAFPEVMAATGAMLIGRGTYEVAKQMPDEERTTRAEPSSSSPTILPTSRTRTSHSSPVTSRKPSPRR
jgi:dihydrofolate reductase